MDRLKDLQILENARRSPTNNNYEFKEDAPNQNKKINIITIKKFASEKFNRSPTLKHIILSEKDDLTITEFIAKMSVWLKLLDYEK